MSEECHSGLMIGMTIISIRSQYLYVKPKQGYDYREAIAAANTAPAS